MTIGGTPYNLAVNDEYVKFLLKITSPDESVVFDEEAFAIDPQSLPEHEEKLRRYSEFLRRFSAMRSEEISEAKSQGGTADIKLDAFGASGRRSVCTTGTRSSFS